MWSRTRKPQHPEKLALFRKKLDSLSWDDERKLSSLSQLFVEVDNLVQAEIDYYYSARKLRSRLSGVARIVGWILATGGLLMPLIAATDPTGSKMLLPWGYVLFAAAGSIFAGNSLLGGSTGHIRFVSAQLSLEKAMTESRIGWQAYMESVSRKPLTEEKIAEGFAFILSYAESLYATTLSETSEWAESTLRELEKYVSSITKASGSSGRSSRTKRKARKSHERL